MPILRMPGYQSLRPHTSENVSTSDLLETIDLLQAQIAGLQADLEAERQIRAEFDSMLTVEKRYRHKPDIEVDMELYLSGTRTDEHVFEKYYMISVDQVQDLFERREKWNGYEHAIPILSFGTDLYHTGEGPPPADLKYGYQGVVKAVKACLAWEHLDGHAEIDYCQEVFRDLNKACREFWNAWDR